LFLLHAMAMAAWFVPLTNVLDAYGYGAIRPAAFATSSVAALLSPLLFGAVADRHVSPVRVLRWLAVATGVLMAMAGQAIERRWPAWVVLAVIQVYALAAAPTWALSNTIVLGRLRNPPREFGPVRALGTLGWMGGCWLVSVLGADASTRASYTGAILWMLLAGFTYLVPAVGPVPATGRLTLRQRLGLDALTLLENRDHRVVFLTAALVSIPLAAFYPFTPPHLRDLGLVRTSAWMSLGQVSEFLTMFGLAALLGGFRLKWIFAGGLGFAFVRYVLCAFDGQPWVLSGVSLHGFAFTLFFITAPIYLNERVDLAWRARAQSLMVLMTQGIGNLAGFLGCGWWFSLCRTPLGMRWSLFWGGLAMVVALVLAYFLLTYRGRGRASDPTDAQPSGDAVS
jgi:hypothetical protein